MGEDSVAVAAETIDEMADMVVDVAPQTCSRSSQASQAKRRLESSISPGWQARQDD